MRQQLRQGSTKQQAGPLVNPADMPPFVPCTSLRVLNARPLSKELVLAASFLWNVCVAWTEFDILRSEGHDLLEIAGGGYQLVMMSTPCTTWSRARHSNVKGPYPLRNRQPPWGFLWAKRADKITAILEHPEDLGRAVGNCQCSGLGDFRNCIAAVLVRS